MIDLSNADVIKYHDLVTPAMIVAEAKRRGYKIKIDGLKTRIGGSPVTSGADVWMNAANVRLWKEEEKLQQE